jgi:hypothetical protein
MTGFLVELMSEAGLAGQAAVIVIAICATLVMAMVCAAVARALFAADPAVRTDARHVLRDLLGSFFRRPN